mmetsp:Transcript_15734/g.45357  ORF Transcript_15734/g.45357 Transcript_15734/m.45357 type:complete len:225 (+) Transcript_15734:830-1504(+)
MDLQLSVGLQRNTRSWCVQVMSGWHAKPNRKAESATSTSLRAARSLLCGGGIGRRPALIRKRVRLAKKPRQYSSIAMPFTSTIKSPGHFLPRLGTSRAACATWFYQAIATSVREQIEAFEWHDDFSYLLIYITSSIRVTTLTPLGCSSRRDSVARGSFSASVVIILFIWNSYFRYKNKLISVRLAPSQTRTMDPFSKTDDATRPSPMAKERVCVLALFVMLPTV